MPGPLITHRAIPPRRPRHRWSWRAAAGGAALLVGIGTACTVPASDREVKGDGARASAVDASVSSAVDGVNAFGATLWQQLAADGPPPNVVIAPPAAALALGMVGTGADGDTARQLADVLHVDDPEAIRSEHNVVSQYLAGRTGDQRNAYRKGLVSPRADAALWAQVGTQLDQAYLDDLAASYGLGVRLVDFRSDPDGAQQTLRQRATEDLPFAPPGLVDATPVGETTKLLSLSAGSIQAPWEIPFDPGATTDAPFTRADGSVVQVPMMVRSTDAEVLSGTGAGWEAVDLPYLGGTTALLIVVPTGASVAEFAKALDAAMVQDIAQQLAVSEIEVHLPRFAVASRHALGPVLSRLEATSVFDPATADLAGMTDDEGLSLGPIDHGATLRVDEEGSDAVVASVAEVTASPPAPRRVVVDRPFFFAVRDKDSGLVELAGWVADPSLTPGQV